MDYLLVILIVLLLATMVAFYQLNARVKQLEDKEGEHIAH